MKTNSQQSFLFRFKIQFKAVSTSYTVQVVSNDSLHVPIKRTHNCSSNKHPCSSDASEKSNQRSQTGKQSSLWPFLLTTCCQPTVSTPSSTVPSVPWRFLFLSLSQHSSTYTARQTTMLQAPISRSPVSANIRQAPLLLHTTEPQEFNYSRITLQMWQLNQGHWQSKLDPPGSHANVSQLCGN